MNNQTVTRYYYNGDSLTGLVKGNQTVQFVYDAEGRPFLMRVYTANNGTPSDYYYLYNGQGDVTGLIDSSNSTVVHYTYDNWGKMVSVTDTSNASISTLNPFRYRGYIYDPETELYYLQSRYYDAEVGRFVNADYVSTLNSNNDFASFNLFVYCGNNPASRSDPFGTDWRTVFAVGLTVAIIGLVVLATFPFSGPLLAGMGAAAATSTAAATTSTIAAAAITSVAAGLAVATESILFAASKKISSPGRMQREVEKDQAPREVESVHKAHNSGVNDQKPHVHIKDKTSMNYDGTIHDKLGGVPKITRSVAKWLGKHGWAQTIK